MNAFWQFEKREAMARNRLARAVVAAVLACVGVLALSSCEDEDKKPEAQKSAEETAAHRNNYIPKNDIEGRNYNARMRLSDDPATIIWCTVYPTNQNVKAFTVPIAGKLTSGDKRPYPTSREAAGGSDGVIGQDFYTPELPGSDGFYGNSGEYRYGFGPDGVYHDFYGVQIYCTTSPTIIQRETTQIAITNNGGDLRGLDKKAEAALKVCRESDTDPRTPCAAAMKILGME